jgi:hypothetical protein
MLENEKSGPKGGRDRFLNNRNTIREESVSRYLYIAGTRRVGTAVALREEKCHRQYRRPREEKGTSDFGNLIVRKQLPMRCGVLLSVQCPNRPDRGWKVR